MTGHDPEINELRDKVHCGVVLERTPPPWNWIGRRARSSA